MCPPPTPPPQSPPIRSTTDLLNAISHYPHLGKLIFTLYLAEPRWRGRLEILKGRFLIVSGSGRLTPAVKGATVLGIFKDIVRLPREEVWQMEALMKAIIPFMEWSILYSPREYDVSFDRELRAAAKQLKSDPRFRSVDLWDTPTILFPMFYNWVETPYHAYYNLPAKKRDNFSTWNEQVGRRALDCLADLGWTMLEKWKHDPLRERIQGFVGIPQEWRQGWYMPGNGSAEGEPHSWWGVTRLVDIGEVKLCTEWEEGGGHGMLWMT